MIDPAHVEMTPINDNTTNVIQLDVIPDYEDTIYDLNDEKSFSRFVVDLEREVRGSYEYKKLIKYLKDHKGMNRCAFFEKTTIDPESKVTIEIHHHPFTLYDICMAVCTKRQYYGESMELEMVAKEVMQLHYEGKVGLIPLSKTPHSLYHNGFLQIPLKNVYGNWRDFRNQYYDFLSDEQKDLIERIIQFDADYEKENALRVLQQKNLYIQSGIEEYRLPDLRPVLDRVTDRMIAIKQNHYQLPSVTDTEYNNQKLLVKNKKKEEQEKLNNRFCPFIEWGGSVFLTPRRECHGN